MSQQAKALSDTNVTSALQRVDLQSAKDDTGATVATEELFAPEFDFSEAEADTESATASLAAAMQRSARANKVSASGNYRRSGTGIPPPSWHG